MFFHDTQSSLFDRLRCRALHYYVTPLAVPSTRRRTRLRRVPFVVFAICALRHRRRRSRRRRTLLLTAGNHCVNANTYMPYRIGVARNTFQGGFYATCKNNLESLSEQCRNYFYFHFCLFYFRLHMLIYRCGACIPCAKNRGRKKGNAALRIFRRVLRHQNTTSLPL